jgi:hypothetical protein
MPSLATFDHAMLRPGRNVPAYRQLGGGTLVMHGDNQPARVAGVDAVVYRLENIPFGKIALRCFLSDELNSSTLARYQRLSRDGTLRRLRSPEHSPLVAFIKLFPDGVLLPGPDFRSLPEPIVAMEWIDGPTLIEAVDRACRLGERRVLSALANSWLRAMASNHEVDFSHGSLSGHNVLIDLERGPVLVDYDTAWWPGAASVAKESPPAAYRHPRGLSSAPERRDDFAALVIYVSIRALSIQPELRENFGESPGTVDGALLFTARDLADPNKSRLFQSLRLIDDDEFQAIVGILREACGANVDSVPPVDDAWRAAAAVVEERKRLAALPDLSPPIEPTARDHTSTWQDEKSQRTRQQRESLITRFVRAVGNQDEAEVIEFWPQVRDSAEASQYSLRATELMTKHFAQVTGKAMADDDDATLVKAVEDAQRLVIAVKPAVRRAYRKSLRLTRIKRRLMQAVEADDRQTLADMALTGEAAELRGLPSAAQTAIRRAVMWQSLERAIEADSDREILAAATDDLMSDPEYLEAETMSRIALSRQRGDWLKAYRIALKRRDGGALADLLASAPKGAPGRLGPSERRRADRLIAQRRAVARLREALVAGSDRALVDAMNEIETSGALLPDDLNWASIQGVVDRLSIIASIRRAALSTPPDYLRLGRLLPAAREIFADGTPYLGTKLDFTELELEVRRAAHRERLREAIRTRDDVAIASAATPDPYGVISTLQDRERQIVEEALQRMKRIDPLVGADPRPESPPGAVVPGAIT